jgi:hypothetical protein
MVKKEFPTGSGQISESGFTFFLANYTQFAMIHDVIPDWVVAGVNVVLKKSYDDDFTTYPRKPHWNSQMLSLK